MRKLHLKYLSAVLLAASLIGLFGITGVIAYSADFSPAMSHLREGIVLQKCGLVNCELTFKIEDFERVLGVKKLEGITVQSLPEPSDGVLKLGGIDVYAGQAISRGVISSLTFIPFPDRASSAAFTFSAGISASQSPSDAAYTFSSAHTKTAQDQIISVRCEMYILPAINTSPQIGDVGLTTMKNITAYQMMKAADPDGDAITCSITSLPKRGRVEVGDGGVFVYTPNKGFTGKDSFEYVVRDCFGNESKRARVNVDVTRPKTELYYEDMARNFAHNSAVKLAGIMGGYKENGKDVFKPDDLITRAEFTAVAMRAAGLDKYSNSYKTVFADDSDIPAELKGCIAQALNQNIIRGVSSSDELYFNPNYAITRSEAAVILNNILKAPSPQTAPVFKDASAIPAWAADSISALKQCGIIKGNPDGSMNPSEPLTRAQAAELAASLMDYLKK